VELPNQQFTDEQLATRVQGGDLEGFNVLITRYRDKILRYGHKFLLEPGDIEDVSQEIFLKAYRYIQSFDPERKFSPWMYRIAHNEYINIGKKRKSEPLDFFDFDSFFPHPQAADNPVRDIHEKETKKMLDTCLDKLPDKYREPLVLYYYEDLDYKDIAEVLHIPVPAVGVRLNRAKKKLKEIAEHISDRTHL